MPKHKTLKPLSALPKSSARPATPDRPVDDRAVIDELRSKVGELIGNDPAKAATVLTEWLKAAAKKKAG